MNISILVPAPVEGLHYIEGKRLSPELVEGQPLGIIDQTLGIDISANFFYIFFNFMIESRFPPKLRSTIFLLILALHRVTDIIPKNDALREFLRRKGYEVFEEITEYGYSISDKNSATRLIGKISVIENYLEIALKMKFIKFENVAVLKREYDALIHFFESELESAMSRPIPFSAPSNITGVSKSDGTELITTGKENQEKSVVWDAWSVKAGVDASGSGGDDSIPAEVGLSPAYNISLTMSERQRTILGYFLKNGKGKISDVSPYLNTVSSKTIQRDLQDLVEKNLLKKEGEKRWTIYSIKN